MPNKIKSANLFYSTLTWLRYIQAVTKMISQKNPRILGSKIRLKFPIIREGSTNASPKFSEHGKLGEKTHSS